VNLVLPLREEVVGSRGHIKVSENLKIKNIGRDLNKIMANKIDKEIQGIINNYEAVIKTIDKKAKKDKKRAYGGILRAAIGDLVQNGIAKKLILVAWILLEKNPKRISFSSERIKIPIKKEYIEKIESPVIKKFLLDNIDKCWYGQKTDLHVFIDGKFVMAIECKTYTENAMMKRILVDFTLLKEVYPNLDCVLFQLENQLGGDYSNLGDITLGSFSTHTLLSFFNIDILIITLLQGERRVDQPIHIPEYYKPLPKESLYKAIQTFKELLEKYE